MIVRVLDFANIRKIIGQGGQLRRGLAAGEHHLQPRRLVLQKFQQPLLGQQLVIVAGDDLIQHQQPGVAVLGGGDGLLQQVAANCGGGGSLLVVQIFVKAKTFSCLY